MKWSDKDYLTDSRVGCILTLPCGVSWSFIFEQKGVSWSFKGLAYKFQGEGFRNMEEACRYIEKHFAGELDVTQI